jgi:hypothetical protein
LLCCQLSPPHRCRAVDCFDCIAFAALGHPRLLIRSCAAWWLSPQQQQQQQQQGSRMRRQQQQMRAQVRCMMLFLLCVWAFSYGKHAAVVVPPILCCVQAVAMSSALLPQHSR